MAYRYSLIFLAIFLLLATAKTTHSQVIGGLNIFRIEITGYVKCDAVPSEPAPPESDPVLNGTNVVLDCGGSKKSLAQAVADVNGFYKIVYNSTESLLFDPSTCVVIVRLPILRCFFYPPTGILRATITLVEILQPLLGAVAVFVAGPLQLVT